MFDLETVGSLINFKPKLSEDKQSLEYTFSVKGEAHGSAESPNIAFTGDVVFDISQV